ncbi:LysR family transcriptional regulator [Sphingomonas adhaesiva]|uniref:LysR family transcriptional regulator n=1 Tax=Sphingomonas adhaesiva TaxID=28212 RepID=UPI002FF89366
MDLDARPYRAFIAVADTGSFSRAAEVLHVSQPALSAQIKEFERRLGFALFARSSRTVALTPEGRLFIDRARRLVTETDWANNAAREIRLNQLRIGAAHFTGDIAERNAVIDSFRHDEPDVPLRVLRRSPPQLHDDLDRGDVDVALLLDFAEDERGGIDARGAIGWILAERPLALWIPVTHPLAHADGPVTAEALRDMPVGMIDRSHGVGVAEGVGRILLQSGATLRSLPEGDARSVARQCAQLGWCAIDLGWFGDSGGGAMRSHKVEGWTAVTRLIALARPGDRRDGARRFIDRLGPAAGHG